jgi:ribulose-5-phosphate 4-epimerase/fuculose-1-phosphate aldolase
MSLVKQSVSAEEWQARVDLAAAYRIVAYYGWDDLVFTHISARVPGPEHHFLINPYGMMFDEVTASSLVKVDINGDKVMPSEYETNPAGFIIHSAVHESRDDAHCVMLCILLKVSQYRHSKMDCKLIVNNHSLHYHHCRIMIMRAWR